MSEKSLTLKCNIHFRTGQKGRVEMRAGTAPVRGETPPPPVGRVPKISRLMALAIKFDGMLSRGEVKDYAELARLGHVTRARVTQIMNLMNLAPDIQEAILFLPATERGRDAVKEWQVRPVAAEVMWEEQRQGWLTNAANHLYSMTRSSVVEARRPQTLLRSAAIAKPCTQASTPS